jgi:hypothetical protein
MLIFKIRGLRKSYYGIKRSLWSFNVTEPTFLSDKSNRSLKIINSTRSVFIALLMGLPKNIHQALW